MNDLGIHGGWLTVNRFCNMRCPWCYATGTAFKSKDSMPLDMAKTLIDLMYAVGVRRTILIGGETMFWPHLFETATHMKLLGMKSSVVTNGWLLGFEKFRRRVEQSDISAIGISLKAGNRQQYTDLTGFDGYDRVMEGIREVSKWKHIDVSTSVVVSTAVLSNLDEVVSCAFNNGAKHITIQMCQPTISGDKFDSSYMPDPVAVVQTIVEMYDRIHEISGGRFSIEQSLPRCLWPNDLHHLLEERGQVYYGCHFRTRSGLLFDRWGRILACNHLFDYPLGQYGVDFTDPTSFAKHWKRPELTAFYDKMLEFPAKTCIPCLTFDECGGGCPIQWFVRDPSAVIPNLQEA